MYLRYICPSLLSPLLLRDVYVTTHDLNARYFQAQVER